ncbi:hypothetical protein GCM10011309_18390 [Litorimonas cladophorae]|uniref:Uncharacterized protein n=1 Tax=Litorimonas cladophorae TaxID=1220491 RepID=A0A918NFE5_9PROT|nr:hypothetical protein GCM10011309_18390 [Litorimonas cladophorae]
MSWAEILLEVCAKLGVNTANSSEVRTPKNRNALYTFGFNCLRYTPIFAPLVANIAINSLYWPHSI